MSHMAESLIITQWNCNGIRARASEIHNLVHVSDVVCVQETKLSADVPYSLPGFNIVRRDRTDPYIVNEEISTRSNTQTGGGVMIAIRSEMLYRSLDTPTLY